MFNEIVKAINIILNISQAVTVAIIFHLETVIIFDLLYIYMYVHKLSVSCHTPHEAGNN